MSDENKFTRVKQKNEIVHKSRAGLIIFILILLLIIGLIIASFFVKDKEGVLYIDKIKAILTREEIKDVEKERLTEYLIIEDRQGSNENFKYEYIVFTDKLPETLYKDFLSEQDLFVKQDSEKDFEKRESKSHAEIYDDILFIYSVHTFYISEMPTFSNIYSLIIDLKTNTLMSNNDIIAKFDYNLEGLYTKVLEYIAENTKAPTFYWDNGVNKMSKEQFKHNILLYANNLTNVKEKLINFYIKDGKLYISFLEPIILQHVYVEYDKGSIDETEQSFELYIIPKE